MNIDIRLIEFNANHSIFGTIVKIDGQDKKAILKDEKSRTENGKKVTEIRFEIYAPVLLDTQFITGDLRRWIVCEVGHGSEIGHGKAVLF